MQFPGHESCSEIGWLQQLQTEGKGEGSTRGGKQPRRGEEVTPGTQGLDPSPPPVGRDSVAGRGRFRTGSCHGERGVRGLEGALEMGPPRQLPASPESFACVLSEACCPSPPPSSGAIFPQRLAWLTDSTVLAAGTSPWRKTARGRCVRPATPTASSSAPRSSRPRRSLRWAVAM